MISMTKHIQYCKAVASRKMITRHINLCVAIATMIGLLSSQAVQVEGLEPASTADTVPPSTAAPAAPAAPDEKVKELVIDLANIIGEFKSSDSQIKAVVRASMKYANGLGSMYQKQKLTDCVFVVGPNGEEREFKTHKVILAAVSPVFESAFAKANKFRMTDWKPSEFEQLLRFIYSGELCFADFNEARALLKMFSALAMDAAKDAARNFITQHLHQIRFSDNSAHVLQALDSARQADDQKLLHLVFQFLAERTSDAMKNPEFMNISQDNLGDLLKRDDLNVTSEMEIYDTVLLWSWNQLFKLKDGNKKIEANPKILRDIIGPNILKNIRFLTMNLADFDKLSGDTKIKLDWVESLAVQQNIRNPNSIQFQMPDTLSNSTVKRSLNMIAKEFTFKSAHATKLQCGEMDTYASKHGFQITKILPGSFIMFGIQIPKSLEARTTCGLKERFDVQILNSENELVYIYKYNQAPPCKTLRAIFNNVNSIGSATDVPSDNQLISVKFQPFFTLESSENYTIKIVFLENREYPTFVGGGLAIEKAEKMGYSSYGRSNLMGHDIYYFNLYKRSFVYSLIYYSHG